VIESAEKCIAAYEADPERLHRARARVEATQVDQELAAAEGMKRAALPAPEPAALTVAETLNGAGTEHQRPRRVRNRPGPVAPKNDQKYLPGGFYRMPNELIDTALLAIMPGPVLKAYVLGHRLARIDGTFYVSAGTLAERIGAKSRRHGERVLARLQRAGLIRLVERGSAATKRANVYQLVPLETLELEQIRAAFESPEATSAVADPVSVERPERSLSIA
jgi:hypothetical protein